VSSWTLAWFAAANAGCAAWNFAGPLSDLSPIIGSFNVAVAVLCGLSALGGDS
jgi:hypothetical protein